MIKRFLSTTNMSTSPLVMLIEHGSAGIIQLNRPEALNASNAEMYKEVHRLLKKLETEKDIVIFKGSGKVFCAGGDVKEVTSLPLEALKNAYRDPYRSMDIIANYDKPYVALMDGLALGGAAIYTMSARFCVATERTTYAMPETAIGYFNDAGSSYFLPRLKNNFGIYLGLTGVRIKGFDVKKVGLASHFIESSRLDDLETKLIECKSKENLQRILDKFSSDPLNTDTELDLILPRVEKCFSGSTVEEILENLDKDGSDWAKKTLKILSKTSPTSLKVTHRSMTRGKHLSLRECLKTEFRLVIQHYLDSDLKEGCRAVLIDKDFKPKWNPKTLKEVTDEHVERFFQPVPNGDELTFENEQSKL